MATPWFRLWADMPNDPKWRTISRVSRQPISAVLAVYIHLLVIASNATERGRTQNLHSEDIASALDLDTDQIDAIIAAMQGRVLDGDKVTGWEKRQPKREDGAAERAKSWRETKRERNRTQPNAKNAPDTDTDTDKKEEKEASLPKETPPASPTKKSFKQWDKNDLLEKVKELNRSHILSAEEERCFLEYWAEPTPSGKMRMTKQEAWDTKRRMQNWTNKNRPGTQHREAGGLVL